MGIFGSIKGLIIRKKKVEPPPEEPLESLPPLTSDREALEPLRENPPLEPLPRYSETKYSEKENVEMSNLKAKLDLLLTQIDSIKIQNKNIEERLKGIEKSLAEMRGIRYY